MQDLPEEPISLYGCESTKLYLGFSIRLSIKEKEAETGREYKRNGIIANQGWERIPVLTVGESGYYLGV